MPATQADDLGWFTPPDLDLLFKALSKLPNPESFVLVGGQALSFWVDWFDIPLPPLKSPYLTTDADFMGSHLDAQVLAHELGATIKTATMDDHTPNLAVLTYQGYEGQKLLIDVLSGVIGLSDDEVRKLAVELVRKDAPLFVMHPVLCLKSRISNLHRLSFKRNGNGISQARVAVEVARRFFAVMHEIDNERQALKWAKEIRAMALSDAGLFVFANYQIDVLDAVDPAAFKSPRFAIDDWPQVRKWTEQRREKWIAKLNHPS